MRPGPMRLGPMRPAGVTGIAFWLSVAALLLMLGTILGQLGILTDMAGGAMTPH